jgi:hypothetical protein
VLAGGARHLCSRAASGIMPAGTMTGTRGARCNRGRRRRETPAILGAAPREAWPEAESLGCVSPLDKSRRGTPTGERALQGARWPRGTAVEQQRLSAFRFLFCFFRSCAVPDRDAPALHSRLRLTKIGFCFLAARFFGFLAWLAHNSGAKKKRAARTRSSCFTLPWRGRCLMTGSHLQQPLGVAGERR